jgi:hypothetical protein
MRSIWVVALATVPLLGQVVETKRGPVEFIGLEAWTPKAMEAKLGYSSDEQLHYCAADLKKAGFPGASVVIHVGDGKSLYTVVTVVEPQRAGEVVYRTPQAREMELPSSWAPLREAVGSGHLLSGAIFRYADPGKAKAPEWFAALRERRTDADYQKAVELLTGAKDAVYRRVAALVLLNFGDRDGAWRALAGGLRDSDESVSGVCEQALGALRRQAPRKVDWAPAIGDLVPVLRGTNLYWVPRIAADSGGHGSRPGSRGAASGPRWRTG